MVKELRQRFTALPPRLTPKVPFINIIMIGITGSGKSSFLRTFTTALKDRGTMGDNYRAGPLQGREGSSTKKVRSNKPHFNKCNNSNIIQIKNLKYKC